ncbi:MAG: hypothetical protein IJJ33_02735 [Victivallales bacterium]|nr:hypothetical protein [Victivallales bacterium]
MNARTKMLKERVQCTMRAWQTDGSALRDALESGMRECGDDLLTYSALGKCLAGLDEIMGRVMGVSAVLCVLHTAEKTKEP